MTRVAVIGLLVFSAAVLQTALFPHLAIAGYRPDLLLLVTAAFALHDGASTGVLVGFTAGVVTDLLLFQPSLGLSAVVLVSIGYTVGLVRPYLAIGSVTAPVAVALVSGMVGTAGYGLLSRLLGDPRYTFELVVQASLMVALYNTLLAPPAFVLVGGLTNRFPPQRTAPL